MARVRAEPDDAHVVAALGLYEDDRRRGLVEGFILARESPQAIAERFALSLGTVELYQLVAFDVDHLGPADRALLAHDPTTPPLVCKLRGVGLQGSWALDHLLGLRDLDDTQRRQLEARVDDRLLAQAARSTDPVELQQLVATRAKLRGGKPEQPEGVKGELDDLLKRMRDKLEQTSSPPGLPDLESVLARPQKKQADRDHTANTVP